MFRNSTCLIFFVEIYLLENLGIFNFPSKKDTNFCQHGIKVQRGNLRGGGTCQGAIVKGVPCGQKGATVRFVSSLAGPCYRNEYPTRIYTIHSKKKRTRICMYTYIRLYSFVLEYRPYFPLLQYGLRIIRAGGRARKSARPGRGEEMLGARPLAVGQSAISGHLGHLSRPAEVI